MNVTLRQLRAFVAVARLGSFVRAAESLFLTQAALSHLIRQLETQVGVRLIDRTTRSVQLSKAGEVYLPHAERILADLTAAERCSEDLREGKLGSVRIAATHVMSATVVPRLIARYEEEYPDTRVNLLDSTADALPVLVAQGQADLALGPEREPVEQVVSEPVFADDLVLVCPPSHRLAALERVPWAELAHERLIMAGRGAALRTAIDINFAFRVEPAIEVQHFTTSIALAAAGQGVVIASTFFQPFLAAYGLMMLPLVEPSVQRQYLLHLQEGRALTPAAEHFRAFLLRQLARPAKA